MGPTERLTAHIARVTECDRFFRSFWLHLSEEEKMAYRLLWEGIEMENEGALDSVAERHSLAHDISKRWFVRVQEREFQYHRIPADWATFARDGRAKEHLYAEALTRLRSFVGLFDGNEAAVLYGGIKTEESLDRKLFEERSGSSLRLNVLDLWDVVRFRLIASSLRDVLRYSIRFWETFFDDILRCRNYYFNPRSGYLGDPYRAIHFELANQGGQMVEVQLMTRRREAVALLDHAALFKRTVPGFTKHDEEWLLKFSMKANIVDVNECAEAWTTE